MVIVTKMNGLYRQVWPKGDCHQNW